MNGAGKVAVTGFYTGSVNFGNTILGTLGATQIFIARMGTTTGGGGTTSGGTTGGGTTGGGTTGGGTTGGGTTTPPTPVAPGFVSATRLVVGKGRHQKVVGFMLNFNGSLRAADAENVAHYQVTQRINRGRMAHVPVRAATINPAGNSVSLMLGAVNKTKPLQLMAAGLSGANGTTVAPVITTLF